MWCPPCWAQYCVEPHPQIKFLHNIYLQWQQQVEHKYPTLHNYIFPPYIYLSTIKICRVDFVLSCFMLSSLPCFPAFCWSAILTSRYIFNVFFALVYMGVILAAWINTCPKFQPALLSESRPGNHGLLVSLLPTMKCVNYLQKCIGNNTLVAPSCVWWWSPTLLLNSQPQKGPKHAGPTNSFWEWACRKHVYKMKTSVIDTVYHSAWCYIWENRTIKRLFLAWRVWLWSIHKKLGIWGKCILADCNLLPWPHSNPCGNGLSPKELKDVHGLLLPVSTSVGEVETDRVHD